MFCRIQVEGLSLSWKKKINKGGVYTINGETLEKIKSDPLSKYGFPDLSTEKVKARLNFWMQWEEPFLVNSPGSHLFDFFTSFRKEAQITPAIQGIKDAVKEMEREASLIEGELSSLRKKKEEVEASLFSVRRVTSLKPYMVRSQELLYELEGVYSCVMENNRVIDSLDTVEKELESLEKKVLLCRELISQSVKLQTSLEALSLFGSEMAYNLSMSKQINWLINLIESTMKDSPDTKMLAELLEIQGEMKSIGESLPILGKEIQSTEEKKKSYEQASQELLKELGVCPTCGKKI